jgi:hypothetical protein
MAKPTQTIPARGAGRGVGGARAGWLRSAGLRSPAQVTRREWPFSDFRRPGVYLGAAAASCE